MTDHTKEKLAADVKSLRDALILWRDYDALDINAPDDVERYQEAIEATHEALYSVE